MSSDVYQRLRDRILEGSYEAGAALTETTLALDLSVSRTPIREALRRLEQDGLVERGARGMQVRSRSPEEILEIYEVRVVLETAAARAAAERHTAFDSMLLDQAHRAMLDTALDDEAQMATTNRAFHRQIWSMSHNATLIDLLARLDSHLIRYRETTLTYPGRWETVLEEHVELVKAIRDRDGERAAAIAESHMVGARNTRLLMYTSDG